MSDSQHGKPAGRSLPKVTLVAAVFVLILALGATFFPHSPGYEMREIFLVYNAQGLDLGRDDLFESMAGVLGEISGHSMELIVADNPGQFRRLAEDGADFILCPDKLALELSPAEYSQMAAGRRKLPHNLRPRGVVVFRKSSGFVERPWELHPRRTVFGDSLSLTSVGGVGSFSALRECSFGPDPYDHGPVLHALRLGAFDFALVRQWDAADFFSSGLLDSEIWAMKSRTIPVPDIVVMVSSEIPLVDRLKWADILALAGRSEGTSSESTQLMIAQLDRLGLVGFNILLEPEFDLLRRNFARHWPVAQD